MPGLALTTEARVEGAHALGFFKQAEENYRVALAQVAHGAVGQSAAARAGEATGIEMCSNDDAE